MKTELLEREITKFLSIIRIAEDQKISEFPRIAELLKTQIDFLDQDLQLLLQVLKSNDIKDLIKIMHTRYFTGVRRREKLKEYESRKY